MAADYAFPDGAIVRRSAPSIVLWADGKYVPIRTLPDGTNIFPGIDCDCDNCQALIKYVDHFLKYGTTYPTVR